MSDKLAEQVQKYKEMFPNHDELLIREIITESRDEQDIIERLSSNDATTTWKKSSKGKTDRTQQRFNNANRTKRPKPVALQKKEEKIRKVVSKPKPVNFGAPSNASWSTLRMDDDAKEQPEVKEPVVEMKPEEQKQEEKPKEVKQEKQEVKQEKQEVKQEKPKEEEKQKEVVEPVQQKETEEKPVEVPQHTEKKKPIVQNTVLYLPKEFANIKPDYNKFGIFAGPIVRQEQHQVKEQELKEEETEKPVQQPTIVVNEEKQENEKEPQQFMKDQQQQQMYYPQQQMFYPCFIPQMPYQGDFGNFPPGFVTSMPIGGVQYPQNNQQNGQENQRNVKPQQFKSVTGEPMQPNFFGYPVYGIPPNGAIQGQRYQYGNQQPQRK